jgi:endonuclease III
LLRLSARTFTNPLTKEEAERMKELIQKEKLTLEEADELREFARKLVSEYGATVPEVWKLLIYASIMRGIAMSELKEENQQT